MIRWLILAIVTSMLGGCFGVGGGDDPAPFLNEPTAARHTISWNTTHEGSAALRFVFGEGAAGSCTLLQRATHRHVVEQEVQMFLHLDQNDELVSFWRTGLPLAAAHIGGDQMIPPGSGEVYEETHSYVGAVSPGDQFALWTTDLAQENQTHQQNITMSIQLLCQEPLDLDAVMVGNDAIVATHGRISGGAGAYVVVAGSLNVGDSVPFESNASFVSLNIMNSGVGAQNVVLHHPDGDTNWTGLPESLSFQGRAGSYRLDIDRAATYDFLFYVMFAGMDVLDDPWSLPSYSFETPGGFA